MTFSWDKVADFYNLTLEVKNINNLNDSLQKMSVPEIIDDFKCSHCNQKVTISKITSLNKLPNVLVVHLKRFYLNYEIFKTMKINSKFEFPKKLNLKQFCVSEIQKNSENKNNEIYTHTDEYYEYELKGINVHTGNADGGHYFSFIDVNREGKNNKINNYPKEYWLQFNDSKVSEFDTETIPKECYGGNYEGYAFENIQNAYLLIYERKIKMPIRVLYEKEDVDKIKKENNNDLITINKENRSEMNKKYDLSRINNKDIKEEDLYQKIFYDKEKEEYYKYIPFYNIPKYAPRKTYNEIMKENKAQENSSDLNDNKFQINQQKYGQVLSTLIKESKLDINDTHYDDKMKESAIVSILDELLISIKAKDEYVGEEGNTAFNDSIFYIFNNLIKPLVKKETSEELLKTIFEMIYNNIFLKFIFTSRYIDNHNYIDKVTNKSNAKLVMEILFDFVKIFFESKKNYRNIGFYMALLEIIKKSNNNKISDVEDNDKYEYTIIFAYQLLDQIIHLHDDILKYLVDRKIISTLAQKLPVENEDIKKIIYKDLNYIIKSSSDYTKELFELNENEKEGRNINCSQEEIIAVLNEANILKCLIYEDLELFIMLLVISTKDDATFLRDFFYIGITQLFDYLIEEKQRFKHVLGYPNPIIIEIKQEDDSPQSPKQKWPIFGEKLINGNIDKQIYEFVNINHRNKILCLLRLLLPNENDDINIPKDIVKKYIIKLIENCLGEKENYSLFKYLYLNPGRSLRYENLYQEMKHIVIEQDKKYNFEQFSEKEAKFIEQIQKEVETSIKKLKEEDINADEEVSDDENPPPLSAKMGFNCPDENMKKFLGFNCNIIPGDIVREEIVQIASGDYLAMFRLEYYAKYYDTKTLREQLLNQEKNNNNDKINIKEDKKEEITEKIEEANPKEEKKLNDKKEEEKEKIDNKEKKSDKKDSLENKEENEKVKEEEKKEEEKKENPQNEEGEKKENTEGENKTEHKEEEKQNDNISKSSISIEIPKESEPNPEEEKNPEEIQPNKEEKPQKDKEEDKTKKEEQKEETEKSSEKETKENTPLETDIDDSLEIREKNKNRTVKKYDVSSVTEDKIIYNILPKRESSIILEDESIKDRNKVKRVLFRFIFTNKSENPKKFRATISINNDLTKLTKNNCCLIPRFIFDKVKEENITNFNNVMRIRGDLPFVERDDSAVSIDITSEINFNKG